MKSKLFWNLFANKYSKMPISDLEAYEKKLDATRKYLGPDKSVLEFGCGTGSTAIVHAPYVKDLFAIDYSKKMIDIANQKKKENKIQNIEFRQGILEDLSSKEQTFDVVLGLNVLHLIKDLQGAIKKSYELLKPGGVLITSTPCVGETPGILKYLLGILSPFAPIPYVNVFSSAVLEKNMRDAGFQILESLAPGKDKSVHFLVAKKKL